MRWQSISTHEKLRYESYLPYQPTAAEIRYITTTPLPYAMPRSTPESPQPRNTLSAAAHRQREEEASPSQARLFHATSSRRHER